MHDTTVKVDFIQKIWPRVRWNKYRFYYHSIYEEKRGALFFAMQFHFVRSTYTFLVCFLFMDFYYAGDKIASFFLRMIEIPKWVLYLPSYSLLTVFFSLWVVCREAKRYWVYTRAQVATKLDGFIIRLILRNYSP